jgi:hypothetical protein
MASETVIDNEFVTMWYHAGSKIVHHQFHKFLHGEPFRECLMEGLKLMKERLAQKWLSDDRMNAALPVEDYEWSTTKWRPRAIGAGWRYWAIVLPEKVVGQMTMNRILQLYEDSPVTVKLFSDPQEALTWLEEQPEKTT